MSGCYLAHTCTMPSLQGQAFQLGQAHRVAMLHRLAHQFALWLLVRINSSGRGIRADLQRRAVPGYGRPCKRSLGSIVDTEVASLPKSGTVGVVALLRIGALQQVDNIVDVVALVAASDAQAEVSPWTCSRPLSSVLATSHQMTLLLLSGRPKCASQYACLGLQQATVSTVSMQQSYQAGACRKLDESCRRPEVATQHDEQPNIHVSMALVYSRPSNTCWQLSALRQMAGWP